MLVLVQLFLWYNIAALYPTISLSGAGELWSTQSNALVSPFSAAVIALVMHQSAYAAEIVRAGIQSVGNGQLKTTAVVSVISLQDVLFSAKIIYQRTYEVIPMPLVAMLWYLLMTLVLSIGQFYVEHYFSCGVTRLHSQLDFSDYNLSGKSDGRKVCSLNPADTQQLGIGDGEIIELYNARGHVLAIARVTDTIMPGVAQLPTGAWYDPVDPTALRPLHRHGNPNVLRLDIGISSLAQG